jgi:hypothetical protein
MRPPHHRNDFEEQPMKKHPTFAATLALAATASRKRRCKPSGPASSR